MTEVQERDVAAIVFERLGYRFADYMLLLQALTHKSFANELLGEEEDNQRLEFLGDAVLGLVVAEVLMERLPRDTEGELTPRRAALVNETSLAEMARQVEIGELLRLGRGEDMNNGRDRPSILADAVEAVVGAVYLDGGLRAVREVLIRWLGPKLEHIIENECPGNAKSALQEALQARGTPTPSYRTTREEGPDHAKVFEVEIAVGKDTLARGRGRSKKEAEKDAAKRAMDTLEEQ